MNFLTFLTIVSVFVSSSISFAGPAEDFAAECARKGLETRGMKRFSTQGADERWFFNASELLHVGAGKFWTGDWKNAAENQQNPIPFLAHFQQLLAEKGIELLLVPVPTKASIYPDKLNGRFKAGEPFSTKPFLELIEAAGLTVLDLEPVFAAERAAGKKIYCEQDSHFSPHACAVIAKLAIDRVREKSWFQGQPRPLEIQRSAPTELGIVGDQVPEE
ncbi:MAG: alginate O-acetyltransferase complex protein AlgJ, partial [Verrucomicrobiales bacterium]